MNGHKWQLSQRMVWMVILHVGLLLTVAAVFMLVDTEYYYYSYENHLEPQQQSRFYDAMDCEDEELKGVLCINYSPERLMLVAGTQAQSLLSQEGRNGPLGIFSTVSPCDNRAIDKLEMVEPGPYVIGIVRLQLSIATAYYMLHYAVVCLPYTRKGQMVLSVGVSVLLFGLTQWLGRRTEGPGSSRPSSNSPLIMSSRKRHRGRLSAPRTHFL